MTSTDEILAEYTIGCAVEIESDHEYRIMAIIIPENSCYAKRLCVFAMPNLTDARLEIAASMTCYFDKPTISTVVGLDTIDWIETNSEHRRLGLATRLWKAAEKVLGRKLVHAPITKEGRKFAESFQKR